MYKRFNIEECLVNLLLKEYKLICIHQDLKEKGIDVEDLLIENLEVVLDIIGFPRDKSYKYDISRLDAIEIDEKKMKKVKEVYFERDFIYDTYNDVIDSIKRLQHIDVIDDGLKLTEYINLPLAKEKFSDFIAWLYLAYEEFLKSIK